MGSSDGIVTGVIFGILLGLLMALILLGMFFLLRAIRGKTMNISWKRTETKFFKENGYSFDMALVMPVYPVGKKLTWWQRKYNHQKVVELLSRAGLETEMFFSVQQDEVYIKIRASLEVIKLQADKTDYKLELDPFCLADRLSMGKKNAEGNWLWLPIKIEDQMNQCRFHPHEFIYGKYSMADDMQDLYRNPTLPPGTIFRGVDRIKIIMRMIEAPEADGGCGLALRKLKMKKVLLGFFPLHDFNELAQLRHAWLRAFQSPNRQPFDQIRNYFGEKIALYFGWLGLYTNWLGYASIAGGITWAIILSQGNNMNSNVILGFAVFMALWSTLYLEKWKQKQVRYALQWGMIGFEEEEEDRVEFYGDTIESPVDGKPFTYFPDNRRAGAFIKSQTTIMSAVILVLGLIAGVMTLNFFIGANRSHDVDDDAVVDNIEISGYNIGSIISFFINAVLIQFGGELFNDIARRLTEAENHRTDTIYEDSLILKSFTFNFINSYTSLFYIAFLARAFGLKCNGHDDQCMEALNTALGTIFCTRLIISNLFEVAVPAIVSYKSTQENSLSSKQKEVLKSSLESLKGAAVSNDDSVFDITAVEEQFMLDEYTLHEDLYGDYLEMVLQFGYATLFSTSFSLAPLLAFVNNYVEIRVDAWKVSCQSRRPFPNGAEDIGQWQSLMELLSILQVTTNTAIVCFTSKLPVMQGVRPVYRILFFLIVEHAAIMLKVFIGMICKDVPEEIEIQIDRAALITSKVIDNAVDEDSEINEYAGKEEDLGPPTFAEFTIHASDTEWVDRKMHESLA